MASKNKYKCYYCHKWFTREDLVRHIEKEHMDELPEGFTPLRAAYHMANNKPFEYRRPCRICGQGTDWDENKGRYNFLCGKKSCHDAYVKVMEKNMGNKLRSNSPTQSVEGLEKMLNGRRISGKYKWSDGTYKTYTGSYEKKALEFFDTVLHVNSEDLQSPGPAMEYEFNGSTHIYIPDMYYVPYNLIIEIKDGGDNKNTNQAMADVRRRSLAKEDYIINHTNYNYIRLTNNDFAQLLSVFADLKMNLLENNNSRVIHVNESNNVQYYTLIDPYNSHPIINTKNINMYNKIHSQKKYFNKSYGYYKPTEKTYDKLKKEFSKANRDREDKRKYYMSSELLSLHKYAVIPAQTELYKTSGKFLDKDKYSTISGKANGIGSDSNYSYVVQANKNLKIAPGEEAANIVISLYADDDIKYYWNQFNELNLRNNTNKIARLQVGKPEDRWMGDYAYSVRYSVYEFLSGSIYRNKKTLSSVISYFDQKGYDGFIDPGDWVDSIPKVVLIDPEFCTNIITKNKADKPLKEDTVLAGVAPMVGTNGKMIMVNYLQNNVFAKPTLGIADNIKLNNICTVDAANRLIKTDKRVLRDSKYNLIEVSVDNIETVCKTLYENLGNKVDNQFIYKTLFGHGYYGDPQDQIQFESNAKPCKDMYQLIKEDTDSTMRYIYTGSPYDEEAIIKEFTKILLEVTDEDIEKNKELKPVFAVATFTHSAFGTLITKVSGDKYSHALISFDPYLKSIYSYGIDLVKDKKTGKIKPYNGFYRDSIERHRDKTSTMRVICMMCDSITYKRLKNGVRWYKRNQNKTHYSFVELMRTVTGSNKEVSFKTLGSFCSEFVDAVLKNANIDITNKNSSTVAPQNIGTYTKKNNFFNVYEGKIKDYNGTITKKKVESSKRSIEHDKLNVMTVNSMKSSKDIRKDRGVVYDRIHKFNPNDDKYQKKAANEMTDLSLRSSLNESILFNEDDIYYNKDKFDNGKTNILFIVGLMGSGKTTKAEQMAKERGIEYYQMDKLQLGGKYYYKKLSDYKDFPLFYEFLKGSGKKYFKTLEELTKEYENLGDYQESVFKDFVKFSLKYAKSHKKQKFIIEGAWLISSSINGTPWFDPEDFDNCAVYIMGTSKIVSQLRAARRNSSQYAKTALGRLIYAQWYLYAYSENYTMDEIIATRWRRHFSSLINESSIYYNNDMSILNESKLNKFTKIELTKESIDLYKPKSKYLSHFRIGDDYKGFIWIDEKDNVVAATDVNTKTHIITAIEISKEYQGNKLSYEILDIDVKELGAYELSVNKNNSIAIHVYEKYGFKEYKKDNTMIYMRLENHPLKESGDISLSKFDRYEINNVSDKDKYLKIYPDLNNYIANIKDTDKVKFAFWVKDNEIIGSVCIWYNYGNLISDLIVNPKYRNQGIGTKILDYSVKHMGGTIIDVEKSNKIAYNMYKKYGFKEYHKDNSKYYHMTLNKNIE